MVVPCYNEAPTVGKVVQDCKMALPNATIFVFDNNSTDGTAEVAREAGAEVIESTRQGKGNVVRHMFDVIDADYYVMVDGDDTYPAAAAPELLALIRSTRAGMVVGTRLEEHKTGSFRPFHRFGNHLIARLISRIFGVEVTDVLSGYRVFSRDFVRSIPLMSQGFEIETELTLQAAGKKFITKEHPVTYGERPEGSYSKLSTFGDGWRILKMIFLIFKDYKPMTFFGMIGILLALASLLAGLPAIVDYVRSGIVLHIPLAVLAAALAVIAALSVSIGLVLHTLRNYQNENFEMHRKSSLQMEQYHGRGRVQGR